MHLGMLSIQDCKEDENDKEDEEGGDEVHHCKSPPCAIKNLGSANSSLFCAIGVMPRKLGANNYNNDIDARLKGDLWKNAFGDAGHSGLQGG
jgi:hypothetical protein